MMLDDVRALKKSILYLPENVVAFEVSSIWEGIPFGSSKEKNVYHDHVMSLIGVTSCRPPYPATWFEWEMTRSMMSNKSELVYESERQQAYADSIKAVKMGVACSLIEGPLAYRLMHEFLVIGMPRNETPFEQFYGASRAQGATMYLVCAGVLQATDAMGETIMPLGDATIALNADGTVTTDVDGLPLVIVRAAGFGLRTGDENVDELPFVAKQCAYMCAMCHVRNVIQVDHARDERLKKARVRRGRPPFVDWKTLHVVTPAQARAHERGEKVEVQGIVAAHLVRGHYAHYEDVDGKRLFGKYTGTYWIPAHSRGNREVGEVNKTYELVRTNQ